MEKRTYIVQSGRYTQYVDGQALEFGPGDEIQLTEDEVVAHGSEKFVLAAPGSRPSIVDDGDDSDT